jgi:hypothetical protein
VPGTVEIAPVALPAGATSRRLKRSSPSLRESPRIATWNTVEAMPGPKTTGMAPSDGSKPLRGRLKSALSVWSWTISTRALVVPIAEPARCTDTETSRSPPVLSTSVMPVAANE